MARRQVAMGNPNYAKVVGPDGKWNGKTTLVESKLNKPLHWRKPQRIFACSMSDLFHESADYNWIEHVFSVIDRSPQHTFLILTKRPKAMNTFLCCDSRTYRAWDVNPLSNVHLGVTAENQEQWNLRVPWLLKTPAAKRFVSVEPMLGPVLTGYSLLNKTHIDGVICGGENGPGARPMHLDWVRSLRDQCVAAGAEFYFKGFGAHNEQMQKKEGVCQISAFSTGHVG